MLKRLQFLTAGESHGKGLLGILDGLPSGLEISEEYIDQELKRRQMGHGRGAVSYTHLTLPTIYSV